MSDEEPLVSTTSSVLEIYTASENLPYFTLGISSLPITLVARPTTAPTLTMTVFFLQSTYAGFELLSTQMTLVYY
jgi:hypothetical protein